MIDNTANTAMQYTPTLRERVGHFLFPRKWDEPREATFTVRDFIRTDVKVGLSFADRLRLLVSGRLAVFVKTETENVVGAVNVNAETHVEPPRFLQR